MNWSEIWFEYDTPVAYREFTGWIAVTPNRQLVVIKTWGENEHFTPNISGPLQ